MKKRFLKLAAALLATAAAAAYLPVALPSVDTAVTVLAEGNELPFEPAIVNKTSAEQVKTLAVNYYYTYGTVDGSDKNNLYIIYVYTGKIEDADYICVKKKSDPTTGTMKEINSSKRLDTVYKKIKFKDDSVLSIEDLDNGIYKDNYFVAIKLNNTNAVTPDYSVFEFCAEKYNPGPSQGGNDINDD